ncbi:hypothetical protein N7513_009228 [Penicillium frequentans]|nr:hypothetical protein N7513_009228 [Penicillium glabrum]
MCLVSRTFREIGQRLLFHTFQDNNFPYGDLRKTISFAKAIYHRPKLGEYVKQLGFMHPALQSKPEKLPADDVQMCKLAIQALELGDQEEERWISLMRTYDFGVIIALVVVKLPNLRGDFLDGVIDVATRFKTLFDRDPSFLSQLSFLYINCAPVRNFNLAIYEDFLTRPRLQHLTLKYCYLDDASFPSTWTAGSLAVETLFIRSSRIDSGAIRKLMQACKKLTMFAYQNFVPEARYEPPATAPHFTPAEALDAAHPHKKSLEYFHVELARRAKFGSFRDFTALETIMVPHAYLPKHPELPCSLKQIDITDCNSSIQDIAQNIANDAKRGLYPELLHIRVLTLDARHPLKLPGGRLPLIKTPADCFISFKELFKGTKVNIQICPYGLPYGCEEEYGAEDSDDEDYEDYDLEFDENDGFPPELWDALSGPPEQMPPEGFQILMQAASRDADFAHQGAQGPPGAARRPLGGHAGSNEIPPGLLDLLMEQAMRDPDFAHLRPPGR